MLNKCANQACGEKFKYFGVGRLFLRDVNMVCTMTPEDLIRECYWLCPACAERFKIEFIDGAADLVSVRQKAA